MNSVYVNALHTDRRFELVYVTNIMIEIKMCVKIEISFYINQTRILSSSEQ